MLRVVLSAALLLTAACGASETSATGGGGPSGAGGALDVGPDGWVPLVTAEWSLEPYSENVSDTHEITVDRDIIIGAIRPLAPTGTHHTLLSQSGTAGAGYLYASGVGTEPLAFPAGVGLKLHKGDVLKLQLHLFNTSGDPLQGVSGIEVKELAPEALVQEAGILLAGPMLLLVPPNQESSQAATCHLQESQTVFAVFPHMHQLGKHLKTTVTTGGVDHVVHDGDYDFNHQAFVPFSPIALEAGDTITTECTWNNTTGVDVGWGESSESEMCFSIMYRYPKGGGSFCSG